METLVDFLKNTTQALCNTVDTVVNQEEPGTCCDVECPWHEITETEYVEVFTHVKTVVSSVEYGKISLNSIKKHCEQNDLYMCELYGGLNGNGEWPKYLEVLKYICEQLKSSCICKLENDCPDDVFTCTIMFHE